MLTNQKENFPDSLKGFEHINRYWDKNFNMIAAKILPGEYYVTRSQETIVTVLGSCISACIRDRITGVGGMNHFMLPENNTENDPWNNLATRYGSYAMEHMINDILKHGGKKENLEIKITGGGKIIKSMTDVGSKNIQFVKKYLFIENYTIESEDVGDIYPRKVQYNPATGLLRVKRLKSLANNTIIKRESKYQHEIDDKPISGDIELF